MVDTATSQAPAPIGLTRPLLSRWRPFVDVTADARHRRPADGFALVSGLAILLLVSVRAANPQPWEATVVDWFLQAPDWLDTILEAILLLGSVWAVVVLAGSTLVARRWRLARDLLLAGLGTWVVALWLGELVQRERSAELAELVAAGGGEQYPVVKVAVITALVATATPYLVRPLRRFGAAVVLVERGGGPRHRLRATDRHRCRGRPRHDRGRGGPPRPRIAGGPAERGPGGGRCRRPGRRGARWSPRPGAALGRGHRHRARCPRQPTAGEGARP